MQKILPFLLLAALAGCRTKPHPVAAAAPPTRIDSAARPAPIPQTDSARLLVHLDSLPPVRFPHHSEFGNSNFPQIDISGATHARLTDLRFRLIPRSIGGGTIDGYEEDTTFNLIGYDGLAAWNLIAKRPGFFVAEVNGNGNILATLTYDLRLIDAIRIAAADRAGNRYWHAERFSDISQDLTITIHHLYEVVESSERNYETTGIERSKETWVMDSTGYFKRKRGH